MMLNEFKLIDPIQASLLYCHYLKLFKNDKKLKKRHEYFFDLCNPQNIDFQKEELLKMEIKIKNLLNEFGDNWKEIVQNFINLDEDNSTKQLFIVVLLFDVMEFDVGFFSNISTKYKNKWGIIKLGTKRVTCGYVWKSKIVEYSKEFGCLNELTTILLRDMVSSEFLEYYSVEYQKIGEIEQFEKLKEKIEKLKEKENQ